MDDVREQGRADTAALRRWIDREHAELRLVRSGDLAERPAVDHERDRAENAMAIGRDEQLGMLRAAGDVAQDRAVRSGGPQARAVGRLA
jgi:hypothetical protein